MKNVIEQILMENKTPIFIYDYQIIRQNIYNLLKILPTNGYIYYSMKANPNLAICQIINHLIERIEVSSKGEIECALEAGFKNTNILFSGPGKTGEELVYAIKKGIQINVESIQELKVISDISKQYKKSTKIMLRINPDFNYVRSGIVMTGMPSQFGIDRSETNDAVEIVKSNYNLNLVGISIYLGSQIMEEDSIVKNTSEIIELFLKIEKKYNLQLSELDVGGGFGVSYFNKKELNINLLKTKMQQIFCKYKKLCKKVKISFESGRYILADSGRFITRILYEKKSKGRNYIVCDGGFNNVLISSFFTRDIRGNFPIEVLNKSKQNHELKEYYISGPLCSPRDILGSKIKMPEIEVGDYLIINKVGAYGLTYSPILFISHDIPAEILIKEGRYYTIRSRQCGIPGKQHKLSKKVIQ